MNVKFESAHHNCCFRIDKFEGNAFIVHSLHMPLSSWPRLGYRERISQKSHKPYPHACTRTTRKHSRERRLQQIFSLNFNRSRMTSMKNSCKTELSVLCSRSVHCILYMSCLCVHCVQPAQVGAWFGIASRC